MIDKWFAEEIEKHKSHSDIIAILDDDQRCSFLIDILTKYNVISTSDDWSELLARKEIYNSKKGSTTVLYINREVSSVKFVQEYIHTSPCINLNVIERYIKEKVQQKLGLNINIADDQLLTIAKNSVGQSTDYWSDVIHKNQVIDLNSSVLPFLHNPDQYILTLDDDQKELFVSEIHSFIDIPVSSKPNKTLAKQLAHFIFTALLSGAEDTKANTIYKTWVDSNQYRATLDVYTRSYKLDKIEIWSVPSNHPFSQIDKSQLIDLTTRLEQGESIEEHIPFIRERASNFVPISLGIGYWQDLLILLAYDDSTLPKVKDIESAIDYHIEFIVPIDKAIRNLYSYFLNDHDIMLPLQHLYHHHYLAPFLEVWFKYFDQYHSDQQGTLHQILKTTNVKTAVIVADGLSYDSSVELADLINIPGLSRKYIKAGIPSETEHNMSLIYDHVGVITAVHREREKKLKKDLASMNIGMILLESVTQHTEDYDHIICTFKDIDELGEKSQQRYLKYTKAMFAMAKDKIVQLRQNGYKEIHLITDHGFVLTGILSESEKLDIKVSGNSATNDRYIKSVKHPDQDQLHTLQKDYGKYQYISFAKSIAPFKSKGAYGYSHGGITPQELITPHFIWSLNDSTSNDLDVKIINKDDLQSVMGDYFDIKIAAKYDNNTKSISRLVDLVLFSDNEIVASKERILINRTDEFIQEFSFSGSKSLNLNILDHQTKEKLTVLTVNKDTSRDLGLF